MKNANLYFFFFIVITVNAQWQQIGEDIDGVYHSELGTSVSLSSDGQILAVGAPEAYTYNTGANGLVKVFWNNSGDWEQIGDDILGYYPGRDFGYSVSLNADGSVVAIGARDPGNSPGYVRVFRNNSGTWEQIGDYIEGEATCNNSGWSVSLSSDGLIVAIGAKYNDGVGPNAGHVRIFHNNSDTWEQIGDDIDGDAAYDNFGESVSISSDGSIVAIGAPKNDGNGTKSGHVRIFQNNSSTWEQIGDDIDGEAAGDKSGSSVSISSNGLIVAIGAIKNDDNGAYAGHVRIFQNNSGAWEQIGDDIDGEAGDAFGSSVSINSDGSVVAIGAISNDENGLKSGQVRIFQNNSGIWEQIGENINGEAEGDLFGNSVSINSDGSIVAAGAYHNNGDYGHARVYQDATLGLYDIQNQDHISIYPNPIIDFFSINNEHSKVESFTVLDITGKQVLNQKFHFSNQKLKIDLSSLEKGIYLIIIRTEKEVIKRKIIKE